MPPHDANEACAAPAAARVGLTPAGEARRRLAALTLRTPAERCALTEALGRVLAEDVASDAPTPEAPRATMDGFAVRAADTHVDAPPARLVLVGEVVAGRLPDRALAPGEAMAIPTGGCLPDGADAVVPVESVDRPAGATGGRSRIDVRRAVEPGRNVAAIGSDLAAGGTVVEAGTRLRPADLAALAGVGCVDVPVFARPRVLLLSSGDEVCAPGEVPGPARVRDQHQVLLAALCTGAGAAPTPGGIVADRPEELRARVEAGLADHEVVVLAAGTSVGVRDFALSVLSGVPGAEVLFQGLHIRPGKPTIAAVVRGDRPRLLFGLPGFPTSAAIAFWRFVAPALRALGGETRAWQPGRPIAAILEDEYVSVAGREDYLRVRFVGGLTAGSDDGGDGPPRVVLVPGGPAATSNLLRADGLVIVPAEVSELPRGARVAVHLL